MDEDDTGDLTPWALERVLLNAAKQTPQSFLSHHSECSAACPHLWLRANTIEFFPNSCGPHSVLFTSVG